MRPDSDRFYRGIANSTHELKDKKDALMEELMRRALMQNPDLAEQLQEVKRQQERVDDMRRAETINLYHDMLEKKRAEHVANRKIKYDDKRNYNALNAIRRDSYYKSLPRLEQIQQELDRYWNPRELEPPKELMEEYERLKPKTPSSTTLLRAG